MRRTSLRAYVFQKGEIPVSPLFYLRRRKKEAIIASVAGRTKWETATQTGTRASGAYKQRLFDGFDSRYLLYRAKPVNIREIRKNLISTGFANVKS